MPRRHRGRRVPWTNSGYTLVELVAVMVILGVLAVAALPRFTGVRVFAERGFFEEALAAVRYARKLAVASGCNIEVRVDAAARTLRVGRYGAAGDCTDRSVPAVPVRWPGEDRAMVLNAPDAVVFSADRAFYFDAIGRPRDVGGALITDPAQLAFDIGPRRLQVVPETGLVGGG